MRRPVSKCTVNTYYGHLNTLFLWIVAEGGLSSSPMDTIAVPISHADQINPFTDLLTPKSRPAFPSPSGRSPPAATKPFSFCYQLLQAKV
jgi:hypothetical protein